MRIRPEAERIELLRAAVQHNADRRRPGWAGQLAHAGQLAALFGCGEVTGVFRAEAGGGPSRKAYVMGLLPLAAIPVLIAAAAVRVLPGVLPLLVLFPFAEGAWFGLSMWLWRVPKRQIWLYAFAAGFLLWEGPQPEAPPVRWSQVTDVSDVWADAYNISAEDTRPMLVAYRLRCADGQTITISRSLRNVLDPNPEVRQLLQRVAAPSADGRIPGLPTIDEIITRYARRLGPPAA